MTGVLDDIRNLAVDIRWQNPARDRWTAGPAFPLLGPLAGHEVDARVVNLGSGWHLRLWVFPAGAERYLTVAVAPATPAKTWPWAAGNGAEEAKAAAVRLLHGDADGLVWRHAAVVGWRPMAGLSGWLERGGER